MLLRDEHHRSPHQLQADLHILVLINIIIARSAFFRGNSSYNLEHLRAVSYICLAFPPKEKKCDKFTGNQRRWFYYNTRCCKRLRSVKSAA